MAVRLDKWLQVARMFKTRTKATQACDLGRVRVNGQPAKPHRNLAVGDRVELQQGDWERILIVVDLCERPLPKALAAGVYEDQSPPRPVPDPLRRLMRQPLVQRPTGSGRPTKKERRDIERWQSDESPEAGTDADADADGAQDGE